VTASAADVLVVGLGNPILSDDGVGWCIADTVRDALADHSMTADVEAVGLGGLSLAEMLVGYRRAIIVDAIMTQGGVPGTVYHLKLADLPGTLNLASAHDTNLTTALHALRRFGADVPSDDDIDIVAVEAQDVWTFAETCTASVEAAVPSAVSLVQNLIQEG